MLLAQSLVRFARFPNVRMKHYQLFRLTADKSVKSSESLNMITANSSSVCLRNEFDQWISWLED